MKTPLNVLKVLVAALLAANILLLLNVCRILSLADLRYLAKVDGLIALTLVLALHVAGICLVLYTDKSPDGSGPVNHGLITDCLAGLVLPLAGQIAFHIIHFGLTWLWILMLITIYIGIPSIATFTLAGTIIGFLVAAREKKAEQDHGQLPSESALSDEVSS